MSSARADTACASSIGASALALGTPYDPYQTERTMMRHWILLAIVMIGFAPASLITAQETVKDRKAFIPNRKSVELKGTAIGILLTDGQPILSTEGRSGPQD